MAHLGIKLGGFGKEGDTGVIVQDGKAVQDRVARHIGATDVEQPAKRVGQGDHRRCLAFGAQGRGQTGAFFRTRLTGQSVGMHEGAAHGRFGLIGPDPVDQVGGGAQGDVAARKRGFQLGDLIGGVQPRVIADHACGQMIFDPGAGLHLGPGHGGEMRKVHLTLHLRAIAPVDEHARNVGQHDAEPGRSGEAGQPLQPLIPCRHIFALMDIGARHEETGKALSCQHLAQIGQPGRALSRVGGAVEGLKHAKPFHIGSNILG